MPAYPADAPQNCRVQSPAGYRVSGLRKHLRDGGAEQDKVIYSPEAWCLYYKTVIGMKKFGSSPLTSLKLSITFEIYLSNVHSL